MNRVSVLCEIFQGVDFWISFCRNLLILILKVYLSYAFFIADRLVRACICLRPPFSLIIFSWEF